MGAGNRVNVLPSGVYMEVLLDSTAFHRIFLCNYTAPPQTPPHRPRYGRDTPPQIPFLWTSPVPPVGLPLWHNAGYVAGLIYRYLTKAN